MRPPLPGAGSGKGRFHKTRTHPFPEPLLGKKILPTVGFGKESQHQPRNQRVPKPVPGRLGCPDGPSGRPRPAHNRFRAGGFQKRRNQPRPQPVPGGKTAPKPTPVARIIFNRKTTGARNRFWEPGRPDARAPRTAARARPNKKAGAGRRVRHPAPTGLPA